jgi:hypothetical protein
MFGIVERSGRSWENSDAFDEEAFGLTVHASRRKVRFE